MVAQANLLGGFLWISWCLAQSHGFHFQVGHRSNPVCTTALNAGNNANEMLPVRKGSTVALVTPMTESGAIDFEGLESLLNFHLESGTDNLCLIGTTGEATTMTMDERASVLKAAQNVVQKKIPIIAGTGSINPQSVKAMTQQAIDFGCDGCLVSTPYYVKPPQRGLMKFFVDVADLGLPVVAYNVPGRTAVDMADETSAQLSQHENIVALKDATGDLSRLHSLKKLLTDDDFILLSGDDATTLDFVLQGGDGAISVSANVVPREVADVIRLGREGKESEARKINDKINELHSKLFVESNPIPAKWAMKRMGKIQSGNCRAPLCELDPEHFAIVESAMKQAGVI